jgi:hypothetical protein
MQTFTLTMGRWLRCLVARNPLVRVSDRMEAAAIFVLLIAAVVVVPVAGAVGTAVYDSRVDAFAAERLTVHEVETTATHDTVTTLGYRSSNSTPRQWQFARRTHTGMVSTPENMAVGEQTSIWVDASGGHTERVPSGTDAAIEAVMAAFGLWAAVAAAGTAAWALLRLRLNRMRYAGWDRELDDLADNGGWTNHNA